MSFNDGEKVEKGVQALEIILRHGPAYRLTTVNYFIILY